MVNYRFGATTFAFKFLKMVNRFDATTFAFKFLKMVDILVSKHVKRCHYKNITDHSVSSVSNFMD
jgi:hypothetical protein